MATLGATISTADYVPAASPVFTGDPTAPTATFADNDTSIATTAFVEAARPKYARVTGSNATTSSTTLVDITGLTLALATGATYEFEANLTASTSAVTTGIKYGVNYSSTVSLIEATIIGTLASATPTDRVERIFALNTPSNIFHTTSASTVGGVLIKGVVTTTGVGNLTISHLKVTSGTSTVFIGSFLKVTRIA